MVKIVSLFLVFVLSFIGFAQMEMPEDKVDWDFSVVQDGCDATIIVKLKIVDHWHINALTLPADNFGIPTTFKVNKSKDYKLVGGVVEPKPVEEFDKASGENLRYHAGSIVLKQKVKITSEKDFDLKLDFGFQPCDSIKCLFPFEESFTIRVKGCSEEKGVDAAVDLDSDELIEDESDEIDQDTSVAQVVDAGEDVAASDDVSTLGNKNDKNDPSNRSLWWIFGVSFG